MLNIAVSGCCGKMGRVIYDLITSREDCSVCFGIDISGVKYADFNVYTKVSDIEKKPDVIIDFSHPSLLDDLLDYCLSTGTPIVLATTGYSDEQISQIHKASEQIPVFFTFNMSLGINLLAELAKKATQVLGGQFDIEIIEKHHNQKIDAPSGTAIMLANAINEELNNSYTYVYDRHSVRQKRGKTEIGMHAVRGGTIVGEHEIIFAGRDEVISLSHSASSKEVFAVGSVNAAVYLADKPAGLYDMKNLI
ncbi:MAG: 4-hydroxy-tetrahydrodipicolinate reductase [Clostridiales bacterium]|nr:4-hydroxy-tetrahydrodipicolinate reductase [Clostridiales bacterium]